VPPQSLGISDEQVYKEGKGDCPEFAEWLRYDTVWESCALSDIDPLEVQKYMNKLEEEERKRKSFEERVGIKMPW